MLQAQVVSASATASALLRGVEVWDVAGIGDDNANAR